MRWMILAICFLFHIEAFSQTQFNEPYMMVNLSYGDKWSTQNATDDYQVLSLNHSEAEASINVYAFPYIDSITINAFVQRRRTARYDGWKYIGEREAKLSELEKANADEGYVGIYSRERLQGSRVDSKEPLVAEYYFLKGDKKGYVFSLRTFKSEMKKVQADYKDLLSNFWIGDSNKPQVDIREVNPLDWVLLGQNSQNHGINQNSFDASVTMNVVWNHRFSGYQHQQDQVSQSTS